MIDNEIAIWRLAPLAAPPSGLPGELPGNSPIEKIALRPDPQSLDDATQRLPGGGYTTLRTFSRFRVLRLEDHFARLEESARLVGQALHLDRSRLTHALSQALGEYPQEDMRVRIILDLEKQPGTIYILIDALRTPDPDDYQRGVKVVTRLLQRENPKAKLTGFIETAASVRQKLPAGVNEAVMVGADGRLLEGLSSNFFAVMAGILWTADEGVLSGITRSLVLEVIRAENLPLKYEGAHLTDLANLEEAFITSASRAVLPVTEIDGKRVGNGAPGRVTKRLMAGYRERLEEELETIG